MKSEKLLSKCKRGQSDGQTERRKKKILSKGNWFRKRRKEDCEKESSSSKYVGQTSRSAFERGSEHLKGLIDKNENSPLYKHAAEEHNSDFIEFKMKVLKKHYSAFSRLIHEAVLIERIAANPMISVLNSKSEFGRVSLPRLTLNDEKVAEKESFLPVDGKVSVKRDGKVGKIYVAGPKDDDGQLSQKLTRTLSFWVLRKL